MAVAGVEPKTINARALGFGLGPRMNAAGRLETAQHALDMLVAENPLEALEKAEYLDELNLRRKDIQNVIFDEALRQAESMANDDVLVVSGKGWNHGVIGIVAAKLLERYKKPTYVLEEQEDGEAKGSARSFGEFSAADAIRAAEEVIIKGGGHAAAAGVTLKNEKIPHFREKVNEYYRAQDFKEQLQYLLPKADAQVLDFSEVTEELIRQIARLEPFGNANPEPVLQAQNMLIIGQRRMGVDGQHVKLRAQDAHKNTLEFLAFNAPDHFFKEPGEYTTLWFQPGINEWNGMRSVEGRLVHLE